MSSHAFFSQHIDSLLQHLCQHIYLSFSAILLAIIIGIPLGIWSHQSPLLRRIALPINNVFQTIPTLALLAFLVPLLGIGFKPAIVTLTLYALLPITRNTFTSLDNIDRDMVEAANGLGFTSWQRLRLIELPMALPVIITGIRLATAMAIGITTVAALIGAGGLGEFITEGLALNDSRLILLGAIPTALLALIIDALFAQIEILLKKPIIKASFRKTRWSVVIVSTLLCVWMLASEVMPLNTRQQKIITIGTKNFSESYLLGYLMADMIEANTSLKVDLKLNIGNTTLLHNAILKGAIDIYPEYTGTAYLVVLKQRKKRQEKSIWRYVRQQYKKQFCLIVGAGFGFNNAQTLAVTNDLAKRYHLKTLSDLKNIAPQLMIAAPAGFIQRPDALPALKNVYGLHFKKIIAMQPDLLYQTIHGNDVDIIEVFTTDARIHADHLVALKDDRKIHPHYDAVPIIRETTLEKYPGIKKALAPLAGLIDNQTMRRLNAAVVIQHHSPQQVARQFLRKSGFKV
jgi:osmoprotectant transport system permease protein